MIESPARRRLLRRALVLGGLPLVLAAGTRRVRADGRFTLTSPAFADRATIPQRYTCQGENRSPPLAWTGAPEETKSFALVCSDPDAPAGIWWHWAVFDLDPGLTGLDPGFSRASLVNGARQAKNSFGNIGYGGPCPPRGGGPHRYRFRLYALELAKLDLPDDVDCADVSDEAEDRAIVMAELVGLYAR